MYSIFGISENEFTGNLADVIQQAIHPDDRASVEASNLSVIEKGVPIPLEYRIILPDGSEKIVYAEAGELAFDEDSKPSVLTGFIQDITERKKAEEALLESQVKFRATVEQSNDGITIANTDGQYIMVNPTFCKMTGYTEKELLSMYVTDLLPGQTSLKLFTQVTKQNESGYQEVELMRKDKTTFIALITGSSLEIGNKRYVQGIVRDITEHKQAEYKLQENNSKLELAMQAANMAWWQMDVITGNVTFEKRKAEMLGYSPEMFKHYKDFTALIHPEDYEKTMDAMQGHIYGKLDKYETEYRILSQSGEYKWFYDIGSVVKKGSDNKPLNIIGLVIDITKRKKDEEILRNSEERFRLMFQNSMTGNGHRFSRFLFS